MPLAPPPPPPLQSPFCFEALPLEKATQWESDREFKTDTPVSFDSNFLLHGDVPSGAGTECDSLHQIYICKFAQDCGFARAALVHADDLSLDQRRVFFVLFLHGDFRK